MTSMRVKLNKFYADTGLSISRGSQLFGVSRSTLHRWSNGEGSDYSWQWDQVERVIDNLNSQHKEDKLYGQLVGKNQDERLTILIKAVADTV